MLTYADVYVCRRMLQEQSMAAEAARAEATSLRLALAQVYADVCVCRVC
jgi:hypothetical protein